MQLAQLLNVAGSVSLVDLHGLQSLGEQARVGLAADLAAIDAGLTLTHSPRYG